MPTDLHVALQQYYAGEDGAVEVVVDSYRADVIRDGVIYEIQTGSFNALKKKLKDLIQRHQVVLVYPATAIKHIVKIEPETGEVLSIRKSPRKGTEVDICQHLPFLAELLAHDNLQLEIALTEERELRCDDGKGAWRRKRVSIIGRELVQVVEVLRFEQPNDYLRLLPDWLPSQFTVAELASAIKRNKWFCGCVVRGLKRVGALEIVGKEGKAFIYRPCAEIPSPKK